MGTLNTSNLSQEVFGKAADRIVLDGLHSIESLCGNSMNFREPGQSGITFRFTAFEDQPELITGEARGLLAKLGILADTLPLATATDTSANPYHYAAFSVSPVDLIAAYELPFFEGNVVKYVTRARYKNGRGDLLKALWYLLWCLGLKKDEIEVMVKQVENHD